MAKTTARNLLARLREDLQDQHEPYLWSESELLRYLNEGQIEFCRQGIPIFDSTSEDVCFLKVKDGDSTVPFDDRILKVRQAILVEDRSVPSGKYYRSLRLHTQDSFLAMNPVYPYDYNMPKRTESLMHQKGNVYDIFFDFDQNHMRLAMIADRDYDIQLSVERIPLEVIDNCDVEVEIHRMHEPAIIAWASYMAFLRQDSETFDENGAMRFRNQFDDYIRRARDEKIRRHSTPGTVQYGGI